MKFTSVLQILTGVQKLQLILALLRAYGTGSVQGQVHRNFEKEDKGGVVQNVDIFRIWSVLKCFLMLVRSKWNFLFGHPGLPNQVVERVAGWATGCVWENTPNKLFY